MSNPIAWSWTRLSMFEKCPKQFHHTHILKDVPKPDNKIFVRGKRVHKKLEDAIKFKATEKLMADTEDTEVARIAPIIEGLFNQGLDELHAELELAWDINMVPSSWFDTKKTWLRCGYDVAAIKGSVAWIWDWKTGKNYGYSDQLKLFAATAFVKWPQVNTVNTRYIYVDQKETEPKTFHRSSYDQIWQDFGNRQTMIQIANETGNWEMKPTPFNCKWCPVNSCPNYQGA